MTDEWEVKRVADLVVGDEVRDYGELRGAEAYPPECRLLFPDSTEHWPAHARVDVRRPVEIMVVKAPSGGGWWVYLKGVVRASLPCEDHAEEYADLLRGSADERRKALGQ